jgi:uncharacterized protein with NRDE domain
MCLIAWHWQPEASEPLVLLSNRDEFFDRSAAALAKWSDAPIYAGRDLRAGGTWLGVGQAGRLAAITNYRTAQPPNPTAQSRGQLAQDFLSSSLSALDYATQVQGNPNAYNPFNLLLFDGVSFVGIEGRDDERRLVQMTPGYGSVSNAGFHSDWPKQRQLMAGLQAQLLRSTFTDEDLLDLLLDQAVVADHALPDTGIGLDKERALSAVFVRMSGYGTRASTLVRWGASEVRIKERSFDANAQLSACVAEVRVPTEPHAHRARET